MPEDPNFEREKWEKDVGFRERELKLKEHEHQPSAWRSPLIIVILTAALAAVGNAAVAVVNGRLERDLEAQKRNAEIQLERSKAESTRILEMIKTGDAESAASNLKFLLAAGLISDPDVSKNVRAYLETREPGTGPTLPSPTERVNFEKSDLLTSGIEQNLKNTLTRYFDHLDQIGFPKPEKPVTVSVEAMGAPNAFYQFAENRVSIDRRLIDDPSVALHVYNHHILTTKDDIGLPGAHAALESGLADYLACSFLDNPYFGEKLGPLFELKTPFIRSLKNTKTYSDLPKGREWDQSQLGGEVWGGLFWDIRERLEDSDEADALVASAWRSYRAHGIGGGVSAFIKALLKEAEAKGPDVVEAVRSALSKRKLNNEANSE